MPPGSPIRKPHWSSKPDVLGACLPDAGTVGWGAGCGSQIPHSLERTSATVIILLMGHPHGSVGFDYTVSPPLPLVLLCFSFLYL